MARMGVFTCWCGSNIAETVDCEEVARYAGTLPGVIVSRDYKYMCSDPGQRLITEAIQEHDLSAVVVASCSPRMHEPTFRKAAATVGLNPYMLEMANIREHCSWVHTDRHDATEKAKDLIRYLVEKVKRNVPLQDIEVPVTQRVMVIGGGIAGIQAALDVASAGYEVDLVERQPSIGGHMAMLDETFPTLDCSQCILTPRMVEIAQSEHITLHPYTEVAQVDGYVGNFKVKLRKKSAYVDFEICNGCGDCAGVCPVSVPDEFNQGFSTRRAVYRPFPQAVPNKFVVDKRGIPPCRDACPAGVNAQGYVALISAGKFREALHLVRDTMPFAGVCGRVCPRPCESSCKRGEYDEPLSICALKRFVYDKHVAEGWEKPEPMELGDKRVAIIGSGPGGLACAYDLVRMGHRAVVYEALPVAGGMLAVGIPEYRLPRDVLEKEIGYIVDLGVEIKTGQALGSEFTVEDLFKQGYGAVVMAVGAHKERRLGVEGEDLDGVSYCVEMLRRVNLGEEVHVGKNVVVIGGGNAATDAARTALRLGADKVTILYRRTRKEMPADHEEVEAALREGIEITFLVAPTKVIGEAGKVTGIECIRMELGEPDESGRRRPVPIDGSEFVVETDMVMPAISQSPELPYAADEQLELTRWGTIKVDETTLQSSRAGVFACGDAVSGPATVIEAVAGGKKVARSVDRYLRGVAEGQELPVELQPAEDFQIPRGTPHAAREKGRALQPDESKGGFGEVELGLTEEQARREAERCLDCGICSECMECVKVCEKEAIDHRMPDTFIEREVGAIIVATGYKLMDPGVYEEYGYGRYPDVVTSLEFERMVCASGPSNGELLRPSTGKPPKTIAFLQCIGSRREVDGLPYCSKICCMYTAKHTILYKHKVHDGQAFVFYMDVRSGGKNYEQFVRRVVKEGMATYVRGRVAKVFPRGDKLIVRGADTLSGSQVEIAAEMVVLAPAVVPSPGVHSLAQTLRVGYDEHGFLLEAHPKLRPVETNTAGVFLAGACHSPQDIPESVAQASAAASKALGLVSHTRLSREPTIGVVDELTCNGCFECEPVCAYGAIERREILDREGAVIAVLARINEGLCQGCGACAATCRSKSIEVQGYRDDQMFAAISAVSR